MNAPPRHMMKAAIENGSSIITAMKLLYKALLYAQDVEHSIWDFAVEIKRLRDAGVSNNDLRWLVCKGFVEHSDEIRLPSQNGRSFHSNGKLVLSDSTCFVPTDEGIHFAQQIGIAPSAVIRIGHSSAAKSNGPAVPPDVIWDEVGRELRVGGEIVKRFRVPAPIQELILSAFQEEGWPARIDDPLPPSPDIDAKQRLHATIGSLNRNQKKDLIRFHGDGYGSGICWEFTGQVHSGAL